MIYMLYIIYIIYRYIPFWLFFIHMYSDSLYNLVAGLNLNISLNINLQTCRMFSFRVYSILH